MNFTTLALAGACPWATLPSCTEDDANKTTTVSASREKIFIGNGLLCHYRRDDQAKYTLSREQSPKSNETTWVLCTPDPVHVTVLLAQNLRRATPTKKHDP